VNAVLTIEHLCVEINDKTILEDISFSLQPGEMVALLGASGAGKSTLLAAICGHRRQTSGCILPGTGAGFVPQIPFEARSPLSVEEIVAMGRPRRGLVTRRDERTRSREILGRLGLAGLESRRLSELSGGERQRVAIATALAFDTPLLLLDEPTSGADPVLADEVLALLKDLTCAGNTVLLAGHDASRLVGCSDRVLGLAGGRLVLDVPASGVVPGTLERVYGRSTS
jgi:ABC-type Mn2+/Zn2+ transport system ATPase subunit